jgi:hypothetical protein
MSLETLFMTDTDLVDAALRKSGLISNGYVLIYVYKLYLCIN